MSRPTPDVHADAPQPEAAEALRRKAGELEALYDTALGVVGRLEPQEVLEAIVAKATELVGCENGYLYVVDEEQGNLEVRVGVGVFSDYLGFRLDRGAGIAGLVWERGEPVAVDEYGSLPRKRSEFDWLHAAVGVPLHAGGEIAGVIGLARVQPGVPFTEDDIALLRRFGQMASLALENARLYAAAQEEVEVRRRAEQQLAEYATALERANARLVTADEMKSQFIATASHELRTPLTSVVGFTTTLLSMWDRLTDEQKREQIQAIQRNGQRLHRLITDLLTMSRIESGTMHVESTPCDVGQIAGTVVSEMFGGAEFVEVDIAPGTIALADPHRLEQILTNYIGNAVKYGAPPFQITAATEAGWIEIRVRDHGAGVPPEFVPQLFERFTQADGGNVRRSTGTGIGLSIVKALAEAQNGTARYEPADPGACFIVGLPRIVSASAGSVYPTA